MLEIEKQSDETIVQYLNTFLVNINKIYQPTFLDWFRTQEKYKQWISFEFQIEKIIKEIEAGLSDYSELDQLLNTALSFFSDSLQEFPKGIN